MMLRLLCWSVFVVLLVAFTSVFAQGKPELEGADVLSQSGCTFNGKPMYCFLIVKDTVLYVAAHDRKGQARIYRVKEMPRDGNIEEDKHLVLLWSRDSV